MKKINNYVGNWSANNGSTYSTGSTDTNKQRLAHVMRNICKGNVFAGNTGSWSVYLLTDDGPEEQPILSGEIIK